MSTNDDENFIRVLKVWRYYAQDIIDALTTSERYDTDYVNARAATIRLIFAIDAWTDRKLSLMRNDPLSNIDWDFIRNGSCPRCKSTRLGYNTLEVGCVQCTWSCVWTELQKQIDGSENESSG